MRKYVKFFLKLAISLVFLFWVIFKVDWQSLLDQIQSANLFYLSIYIFVVIIGLIISAYKWKLLANHKNIHLKFGYFFKYYLTGIFINNFMPSFVGGETFKAYEIGKPQERYVEAASSVMMDRITGIFGATILAVAFTFINLPKILHNSTLLVVNLIVLLSLFIDIFVAKIKNRPFWGRFKKYFPEKFNAFMIDLSTYNHNSHVLKKSVFLSFAYNFVGVALANYILFLALGIKISLVDYLSVIFLISIISSVSISINNIGTKEWAYIAFFGAFGVSPASAVAAAIVNRFIQMLISFFALPVYLRKRN